MPTFNLVDEAWIPCVMVDGDAVREFSLSQTLLQSPDIREILDPSPVVTLALHRLLLAIVHRVFGPEDTSQWHSLWKGGIDSQRVLSYFDRWHERFDLFDDHHPFYQSPSLDFEYERSIALLVPEMASSANSATLFDHTLDASLPPAQSARYLIAFQSFAVGGLISLERGQNPALYKFADAAPLTRAAVCLVKGANLFETLMLNLHRMSPSDDEPFECSPDDAPVWERSEDIKAGDRMPAGYLDLLTWPSRRVRLRPRCGRDGSVSVETVVIMKGNQFPDGWSSHGKETMVAFKKNSKPGKGQDPWPPLGFREDKSSWRNSLALLQSVKEDQDRPKTIDWLHDLVLEGALDRRAVFPLDVYGVSTDKALVRFWRHERLLLPLVYLDDADLLSVLKDGLDLAESVGRLFSGGFVTITTEGGPKKVPSPLLKLAAVALSPLDDTKADPKAVGELLDHLAPGRPYWSRLETPFKRFMVKLAEEKAENKPERAFGEWVGALHDSAASAFREAILGLEGTARTLRAVAIAEREFNRRLRQLLEERLKTGEEV
jgi:CRISPR system Cascade subunit CasA